MRAQSAPIPEPSIDSPYPRATSAPPNPHKRIITKRDLVAAGDALFRDLSSPSTPCQAIMAHFSTIHAPILCHAPASHFPSLSTRSPNALSLSTMVGLNAIRSYFDLLNMHFVRKNMTVNSATTNMHNSSIFVAASIHWQWKQSGKEWREEVTIDISFDDFCKVKAFILKTQSPEDTCVLRAVDPKVSGTSDLNGGDGHGLDAGDVGLVSSLFGLGRLE